MKKAIVTITIIAGLLAAFACGRYYGIQHAVTSAEIWLSDWEEADHGDYKIFIDLDGQRYAHELWIY